MAKEKKPAPQKVECPYCKKKFTEKGLKKHLNGCKKRFDENGDPVKLPPHDRTVYTLKIISMDDRKFWFRIDMDGSCSFKRLDSVIRKLWFDMDDHLSGFIFDQFILTAYPFGSGEEPYFDRNRLGRKGLRRRESFNCSVTLDEIFKDYEQCNYDFDFGSTSSCRIQVENVRTESSDTFDDYQITGRNRWKPEPCSYCGAPAELVDPYIDVFRNHPAYYCEECWEKLLETGEADYTATQYRNSPRIWD